MSGFEWEDRKGQKDKEMAGTVTGDDMPRHYMGNGRFVNRPYGGWVAFEAYLRGV